MPDATTSGDVVSASPLSNRRDAQRNRAALLAAARELFADRGLDVTLDEVARHAGVGVGTAYRNFANKGELVDDLLVERVQDMVDLAAACLEVEDPWTGLRRYVEQALEMQVADRVLKQLLYAQSSAHARVDEVRRRLGPAVTALVVRAKDAGVLRPDVDVTDVPMINIMLGVVVDLSRDDDPELYRRYLELLLASLRVDAAPADALHPPLPLPAFQAAMGRLHERRGRG